MMLSLERLESLLESLPRLNIALLGDLFLDRYLELLPDVCESSLETGLEAYQVARVRNSPGALGTVMNNLAALGVGRLTPITVIGDDGHGFDLMRSLSQLPVDPRLVLQSPRRLTPTYTKPLRPDPVLGWKELNRLDVRTRAPLAEEECEQLQQRLNQAFGSCDGLIVLDQISELNHGVVNDQMREFLAEFSGQRPELLVFVDSRASIQRFRRATLKGNEAEFLTATSAATVDEAVRRLARLAGRPAFCTVGVGGTLIGQPDGQVQRVNGFPAPGPLDIVGAGDSATSGIVSALLAGGTPLEAAELGNLVASITVQQVGTTGTATPRQVRQRWRETRVNPAP